MGNAVSYLEGGAPLADPVAEARRIIDAAREQGIVLRALGGTAVCLAAGSEPLLPRVLKDIDLVTTRREGRAAAELLAGLGYVGDGMFNALHGSRRQLHRDAVNGRDLDLFVGEFSMCHEIPIAERLELETYTVPLAELLLTKLQVVELNDRDECDVYTLCYHRDASSGAAGATEADLIARLCADDWGLWRTCTATLERCRADLERYDIDPAARSVIDGRLGELRARIDAAPRSRKWKRRSRLGDRKRWYLEPEEEA